MANWYNYFVLSNQDLHHQALSQTTKKADNWWTNATKRKRCRRCWSWYERDSLRSKPVISMSSPVMLFFISWDADFEDGRIIFFFYNTVWWCKNRLYVQSYEGRGFTPSNSLITPHLCVIEKPTLIRSLVKWADLCGSVFIHILKF